MTGRVYRIAPPGAEYATPKLDLTTPAGCVAALQSPNQAARYLAWSALHQQLGHAAAESTPSAGSTPEPPQLRTVDSPSTKSMSSLGGAKSPRAELELLKLWKTKNPRMRARAIQLLARIKVSQWKYVEAALNDSDSDIRIVGLRTACSLKMDVLPYIKRLAKDPSPQVRRECAIALRHNDSSDAPKLWTTLAQQYDGKDRWYLEALGIAADKQEDKFFAAWLAQIGDKWNTPAGREIVWRSRSTKAPPLLAKLITDKNTDAKQRDHYMRALDFIKGPERDAALLEIATGAN